jgi:hypothetical protein
MKNSILSKNLFVFLILTAFGLPVFSNECFPVLTNINVTSSSFRFEIASGIELPTYFPGQPTLGVWWYGLRYRKAGANNWTTTYVPIYKIEDPNVVDLVNEIFYTFRINNLNHCTDYEFQLTCNHCVGPHGPFYLVKPIIPTDCVTEINNMFLNGNTSPIMNFSTLPEPVLFEPVENLHIIGALSENEVRVSWNEKVGAFGYKVTVYGSSGVCHYEEFVLSNVASVLGDCQTCNDLTVKVQAIHECDVLSNGTSIHVPIGSCNAIITNIVEGTNDAFVHWDQIYGQPDEVMIEWKPVGSHGQPQSITTSANPVVLTQLESNRFYQIWITPICSNDNCSGTYSSFFTTLCNTFEPNNSLPEAKPITFKHPIYTYAGSDGVDYFSFVPTCNTIDYDVSLNSLGVEFYDKFGNKIEKKFLGIPVGAFPWPSCTYYPVVSGEKYYVKVTGDVEECYSLNIIESNECFNEANQIEGDADMFLYGGAPQERNYMGMFPDEITTWSVNGPGVIKNYIEGGIVLMAYDLGTIQITATMTKCNGEVKQVTREVYISGDEPECSVFPESLPTCSIIQGKSGEVCSNYEGGFYIAAVDGGGYNHVEWTAVTTSLGPPLSVQCSTCFGTNISGFEPNNVYTITFWLKCYETVLRSCAVTVLTTKDCNGGLLLKEIDGDGEPIELDAMQYHHRIDERTNDNDGGQDGKQVVIEANDVVLMPNPVKKGDKIYFNGNNQITVARITDVLGRTYASVSNAGGSHSWEVDTDQLTPGIYFVHYLEVGVKKYKSFLVVEN